MRNTSQGMLGIIYALCDKIGGEVDQKIIRIHSGTRASKSESTTSTRAPTLYPLSITSNPTNSLIWERERDLVYFGMLRSHPQTKLRL